MSLEDARPNHRLADLGHTRLGIHGRARRRRWREGWARFAAQPHGLTGLWIIGAFGLMALAHPLLMATVWDRTVYDPLVGFDAQASSAAPFSPRHLLGTDSRGRDVLSQLLYASGPSLGLGLAAGTVAALAASLAGVLSAYSGGLVDGVLMGLADVVILFPPPIVLLLVGLATDLDGLKLGLLYGLLTGLGSLSVLARAHALSIVVRPYVDAARVAGGSGWHVLRVHVLPAMAPFMLLNAMFVASGAVFTEALLSFFGRTSIRMSWGTMILFGQETFRAARWEGQWHAVLPPALAILLFCAGFLFVGRAVEDMIDLRSQRR